MPIKVTCEKCGGVLHAPDDAGGKKGRCPNCQNILPIPFEGSRTPSAFGTSSGFGGGSSPSNPPAGLAFSSPSNPAAAPAFPNADAKRPAPPPPFGVGARNDTPGLTSSTPGLTPAHAHGAPGMASSLTRQSVPFGARPAPSSAMPIAPESLGWRSTASGLRWIQIAIVFFLISVLAPAGVTAYAVNGGQSLADKPGMLKWENLSLFAEIRLAAFLVPVAIGFMSLMYGRFKVGAVPASSCARGPAKIGAYFTLFSIAGLAAFVAVLIMGIKNSGFVPALEPPAHVLAIDTPTAERVNYYLNNNLFFEANDINGQIQRFGVLGFLVFGKLAELFFGCSLGRIAASARNPVAAGRVTRCYFYFAILGALAVFGILAFELLGHESAREVWSPKWFALPASARTGIVCGVAGLIVLLLTVAYLRMLSGVRRVCVEQGQ